MKTEKNKRMDLNQFRMFTDFKIGGPGNERAVLREDGTMIPNLPVTETGQLIKNMN